VFFDDRPENIRTAKKLGMHAFLFKSVEQFKKDLISVGVEF